MTAADDQNQQPMLELDGIKKYFTQNSGVIDRVLGDVSTVRAVDGVDLALGEGEILGVVGESGCGKSTLAETIVGLHSPTAGTIRFRGDDISDLSDRAMRPYRQEIQMIFQDPLASLNPRRTVGEILKTPLDVHGIGSDDERSERVVDALEEVGLEPDHVRRYPHQFSGGQQQRIAIARSLTVRPTLLIADEPVSSLDVSVQARILELLNRLRRERNISMVFIAHDLSVVKHVVDRVAVMYLGEIVEKAPVRQLFEEPTHPYTKSLLSAVPRIGTGQDGFGNRVVLRGTPPSPVSPPSGCRFHTRCPVVVPPDDWPGTDEQFVDAFHFRKRLEAGDVDTATVEQRVRAEGETPAPALVSRRILESHLNTDLATLPAGPQQTLERATERYVRDGPLAASELLSETFATPCERDTPGETAVAEGHVATCHRAGDEGHSGCWDRP